MPVLVLLDSRIWRKACRFLLKALPASVCRRVALLSCVSLTGAALGFHVLIDKEAEPVAAQDHRCRAERWSCAARSNNAVQSCWDSNSPDECRQGGVWLGPEVPKAWSNDGTCFQLEGCLPSLLNLAPPKSGTTDIYRRLLGHGKVVPGSAEGSPLCGGRPSFWCEKEPNYWLSLTARKLGIEVYTSFYKGLQPQLQATRNAGGAPPLAVDWSPLTFEVNPMWIHAAHPRARFVALLRDPLARAESDYNFAYFVVSRSCPAPRRPHLQGRREKPSDQGSPDHMHRMFHMSVNLFTACTQEPGRKALDCWRRTAASRSLSCATLRPGSNGTTAFVLRGLYSVYLGWFLTVFPAVQFFVRRAEDLDFRSEKNRDRAEANLKELFHFAGLPLIEDLPKASSDSQHLWAPGMDGSKRPTTYVVMTEGSRRLLRDFYEPYILRLQTLFNDTTLRW